MWINLLFASAIAPALAQDLSASCGVERHIDGQPGLGIRLGGQLGLTRDLPLFIGGQLTYTPGALAPSDFAAGLAQIGETVGATFQVPIERRVLSLDLVAGVSPILLQKGALRGGPMVFAGLGYSSYERGFVVSDSNGIAAVEGLTVQPALPLVSGVGLDARFGSHFGIKLSLTGHRILGDAPQFDSDIPAEGRAIHLDRTAALDLEVYL